MLCQNDPSNNQLFFSEDHLGSNRLLTGTDGSEKSTTDYEPYGEPMCWFFDNLPFTGQQRDRDTGLQYHRARWCNPTCTSWLSIDLKYDWPANFASMYLCASGNPINCQDATGEFSMLEIAAVCAIMGMIVISGYESEKGRWLVQWAHCRVRFLLPVSWQHLRH